MRLIQRCSFSQNFSPHASQEFRYSEQNASMLILCGAVFRWVGVNWGPRVSLQSVQLKPDLHFIDLVQTSQQVSHHAHQVVFVASTPVLLINGILFFPPEIIVDVCG